MYVLAQDSTVDVDYSDVQVVSVTDSATAVILIEDARIDNFSIGDVITITGATGDDAADYNTTYTITALAADADGVSITTDTDTSAAAADLDADNGGTAAVAAWTNTEDSERILPADRCIWHIQPALGGGYKSVNVVFYDGNTTSPSAEAGDFRLGYIGKSGRFTPISN